jgi:hypothetical protein
VEKRQASEHAIVDVATVMAREKGWRVAIFGDNCGCNGKRGGDIAPGVRCFPGKLFDSFCADAPRPIDALLIVRYGYFFLEHVPRAQRVVVWIHDTLLSPWWNCQTLPNDGAAILANVAGVTDAIVVNSSSSKSLVSMRCPTIPESKIFSVMEKCMHGPKNKPLPPLPVTRTTAPSPPKRFCIYWVVGVDPAYCDGLTRVSMESVLLALKGTPLEKDVDLFLLCDAPFAAEIGALEEQEFPFCHIAITERNPDAKTSCARKLEVHLIPNVEKYQAVLYLDSDAVVDPMEAEAFVAMLQTSLPPDKLMVRTEDHVAFGSGWETNPWFGIGDFSKEEVQRIEAQKLKPINAGQFLFRPSKKMLAHFQDVLAAFQKGPVSVGWEQSFLNAHFLRLGRDALDTRILGKVAALRGGGDEETRIKGIAIHHMFGLGLSWRQKAHKMKILAKIGDQAALAKEDPDRHEPADAEWWEKMLLFSP